MKILLAGGGTAGHINPALAIAGTIKEKRPDAQFLFIGNKDGMEQRLVPQAGFEIKSITISGFQRSLKPKSVAANLRTLRRTVTSSVGARKIIKDYLAKDDILTNEIELQKAVSIAKSLVDVTLEHLRD